VNINGSVAVVTGANRGIGRALVENLLESGAGKIYAGARDTSKLADLVQLGEGRVIALTLDLHDEAVIETAAKQAMDATLLINNAGAFEFGSQLDADIDGIRRAFETNYYGTMRVVRAFAPILEANHGAIVNVLSIVSLASMPGAGGYSASKAAAHSLTVALRGELARKGVRVLGAYPGPVDTDMAKGLDLPKASPTTVAAAILKGIEADEAYIMPDPMAVQVYEGWRADHAAIEAQFGSM
jgi:NAD(P)-dependent dehydrogenase (short-subunit alcohol dehydrogenase family)